MANEFDEVLDQESAGTLPPLSSGLEKGEFDDVLDTEVSQQQSYVRNVIDIASKDNPEAAAERVRLSQSTGLPPDVVARNQQELKRREIARAIDLQRMMRDSPVLFRQMTDPTFTAAAIDDLDTLRQIEKSFTNIANYAKSGEMASDAGGAAKSLALGATVGVGKMIFDVFGAATDLVGLDYLSGGYRTMSDNARQAMDAYGLQADTSTGRAVKSGLESAGQNLALLPLGLERGLFQTAEAAGAAVAGAMSVGVGADSYQRARGEGVGRLNSALYGINDAGVEFLMEKIPAGQLFKGIELDNSLLKQLAQQTVTEGWTEQVTTIAQDFNEWMALHPEKTTAEFLAERPEAAYQTFIATLIGTGVQTTAIAGINKLVEKASNQALVYEQERFKRQLQLAGMSALRERSPEQFRANMEQVVANAPEGASAEIYVDAEVLNQLGPEMQALLPETVRAQIPEALAMNATVPISMADVLTTTPRTELEQILNDNARIGSPDAPSRVEAEKAAEFIQQDAERVLQQAQDQSAWQSEVDTVQQTIKDQLDQAGRFTSDVNDAEARLQSHFYSVMASRLGITPADMYQRFPLKVTGQMGQGEVLNAGAQFDDATLAETDAMLEANQLDSVDSAYQYMIDDRSHGDEFLAAAAQILYPGEATGINVREWSAGVVALANQMIADTNGDPGELDIARYQAGSSVLNQLEKVLSGKEKVPTFSRLDEVVAWIAERAKNDRVVSPDLDLMSSRGRAEAVDQITKHTLLELKAWSKLKGDYRSFYGEDIEDYTNPLITQYVQERYGRKPTKDEIALIHLASAFGSGQSTPTVDTQHGLTVFDEWMRTGKVTGYSDKPKPIYKAFNRGENPQRVYIDSVTGEDTPIAAGNQPKFDAEKKAQISKTYNVTGLARFMDIHTALGGDLHKTITWLGNKHSFAEIERVIGQEAAKKLKPHEYLDKNGQSFGVFALGNNPKLGSYILNRWGHFGTITKDMWVARTMSRYFDEPNTGEPWDLTKVDLNKRKILEEAWNIVAKRLKVKPAEIQEMMWDAEKKIYARFGQTSEGAYTSSGVELALSRLRNQQSRDGAADPAGTGESPQVLEQQARGTFNPQTLLISLGPQSDLSTFLHESGHFFLEVMADLAAQPDAPAQVREDMDKVRAWFASGSGTAMLAKVEQDAKDAEADASRAEKAGDPDAAQKRAYADQVRSAHTFAVENGGADYMKTVAATFGQDVPRAYRIHLIRQFHERWAESFEQYLLEGKAPSAELQPLFRRFRAWLVNVYKSLTDFMRGRNLEVNDEIRQVFDRMLATDEAIAQAEEQAGLLPDFDATNAAIERLQERSMRALKWTLNARSKFLKQFTKEAKELRKGVYDEVVTEVNQMPEFRAQAALDALQVNPDYTVALNTWKEQRSAALAAAVEELKAQLIAANPDVKGLQKGQLLAKNKKVIANQGEAKALEWEAQNPKPRKADNATDMDRAVIADSFGFPTIEAMLAAINAIGKKSDLINSRVDQIMLERHGDLATPEVREQAANDAVHNEARARALAAELKAQDEALNPRETTGETRQIQVRVGSKKEGTQRVETRTVSVTVNALVEAARAFGADLAARRAVGKLKNAVYLHRAAEARAGKAWQTATKKGDTKAAVQAKKDQLLNNQAVRALLDAQAEVRSAIEFFRKVTKGNNEKLVKGGRDPDVVNAMRAILGVYGIAPRTGKGALEYMEIVQTNDPETAKALMPAVINAVSRNKPYTELTVEELRGLTDDLKSMWRLAKESRQIEVDGVRMSIEDAREKLYGRLEEKGIPDKVPGQTSARTAEDKAAENLRELRGNLTRVEQWSEAMDGSIGGPFNTILFRAIKVAADNYRAARAPVFKRLEEATQAVKPFIARTPINAPRLNYVFGLGDGHNNTGMAELLAALLNTGNESNKRKLLLGGRPGTPWATENPDGTLNTSNWDATIADLVADGTLKKEHFDYVQAVWDVLESLKPLAQESHRRVFGRYFSEVTAQPFVDPFGIARSGGYYPAKVDPALVPDGQLRELARQENESLEFSFPAAPSGWSKSRVENYTKPLLLDTNLVYRHIDEVLLFSHMQPSVNAVNRLLRDRKLVSALSRVSPEAYGSILTPWLAGAARQIVEEQVPSDGGFNRAASIIRSRTGLQLMMANASNTLQQITGAFTAASKLEADGMERSALIKAAAKWASNPKAFRDNVWSLSSYMRDRSENETAVLLDTMRDIMFNPTLMESAQKWSRRHGYFTQVFFDNTLSPVVWSAGYSAYLNKLPKVDTSGMSATEVQALLARQNREAVLYADALVRQTQGSNLPEDVSRFERGTGFVRLFNQFAGYFNMQANTNAASIVKLAEQGGLKKNAARGFYVLMMGLLMPIWVAEAIAIAFRGGPDDDDDDGAVWDDWLKAIFGLGTFKGLVAMVPVAGQIASAAVNRVATGSPADDRVSVSPVLSVLESAVGGNVYTGYQLATGKEVNAQRAVKDMALLIGLATGVPAYAVARPLGYAAGVAQGKIQPTGPVDAARGVITGTASPESKTP